jgi:hypothetical protein
MSDLEPMPSPFPRLAISDLIVLTLTVGFSFAYVAPEFHTALNSPDVNWWRLTPEIIDYFAIGLALFGLIVLARQRIRGDRLPAAPGHWILRAVGPYWVLMLAAEMYRPIAIAYVFRRREVFNAADNILFALVMTSSIAWSAFGLRQIERRWRLCLVLIQAWLLISAVWLVVRSANGLGWIGSFWNRHLLAISFSFWIVAGVMGSAAAIVDLIRGIRRDWLHYVGVASLALETTGVLLSWGKFTAKWWREGLEHLLS